MDVTKYRGIIGSLLYLTASRSDIMFSVWLCARFRSNSKESYLSAVEIFLRYLHGTMNLGLWYRKGTHFEITSYSDVDFAGCQTDHKSTNGTYFFLGYALVSWFSKRKTLVALFTTKAEYISAVSCCAQILWINKLSWILVWVMNMYLSNVVIQVQLTCLKNSILHSRAKHIDIRHHFLRDHM